MKNLKLSIDAVLVTTTIFAQLRDLLYVKNISNVRRLMAECISVVLSVNHKMSEYLLCRTKDV